MFGGIILYALEFVNLSNYLSWIPLIKWSLYLGLPVSFLVATQFFRSNHWVKPMVYRMMFFFALVILSFMPLCIHLANFYLPSRSTEDMEVLLQRVNGHQMNRFGMLEEQKKQSFDYYILEFESQEGTYKFRMDHWIKNEQIDSHILEIRKGFLGIPYLHLRI